MIHLFMYAGLGWLVGCFTPAMGRKMKALFVKESAAVKSKL